MKVIAIFDEILEILNEQTKIVLSNENIEAMRLYPTQVIRRSMEQYNAASGQKNGDPFGYLMRLVQRNAQSIPNVSDNKPKESISDALASMGFANSSSSSSENNRTRTSSNYGTKKESEAEQHQRVAMKRRQQEADEQYQREVEVKRNRENNKNLTQDAWNAQCEKILTAAKTLDDIKDIVAKIFNFNAKTLSPDGSSVLVDRDKLHSYIEIAMSRISMPHIVTKDVRTAQQRMANASRNQKLNALGRYHEAYYGTAVLPSYNI